MDCKTPVVVNVVKPTTHIVPAETPNMAKVANMARICYRSEAASSAENDDKLIRGCVKRGHTSVVEHAFVSVYFPSNNVVDVKAFGMTPPTNGADVVGISTRDIWNTFGCPVKSKFTEEYFDDTIYKEIDTLAAAPKSYRVTVGDFRAWLNIIDDCLAASINKGIPLYVAFMVACAIELDKKFPAIFDGLISKLNEAFKRCTPDHYLREWFLPKDLTDKDPLTTEHFEKFAEVFGIIAAQTTPRYSLSAVWKTSRGVTHEFVRHRVNAFSQESQRWVNYDKKNTFEVIHPMLDPVKWSKYMTPSKGTTAPYDVNIGSEGFIPEGTALYEKWYESMVHAANDYVDLMKIGVTDGSTEDPSAIVDLPPEFCRGVLNNDWATTIGSTWTAAGWINFMKWRLDGAAFWPIRRQAAATLIAGLKLRHPFFENFAPDMIKGWLADTIKYGVMDANSKVIAELNDYQDRRQKAINEAAEAYQKELMARFQAEQEAAAKQAAEQAQETTPKAE